MTKNAMIQIISICLIVCGLTIGFQGCGDIEYVYPDDQGSQTSESSTVPTTPLPALADCNFSGQTITSGQSVQAYPLQTVANGLTCTSQTRVCTDGVLSGTAEYLTCMVQAPASCTFNGQSITSGQSIQAYPVQSVASGSSCAPQTRVCTNGVLSGTAAFLTCSIQAPASCTFNGQTITSGQSIQAYPAQSVPSGSTCTSQTRTCTNGSLSGTAAYSTCLVQSPVTLANCTLNGQTILSGQNIQAYPLPSVPNGSTCTSQTRTCTDGVLSGTAANLTCTVQPPANCTLGGQTIVSGQSIQAYPLASVPNGSTCTSQTRTCTNGILSGTAANLTCTIQPAANCTFNGQTILSGQNIQAYPLQSVPNGSTCTSQTRTCTNGVLSGTAAFSTCTVQAPANCTFNGQTLLSGQSVQAYPLRSVPSGSLCTAENRTCTNGVLSGTAMNATCSVELPPGGTNLILNGGFESGLTEWTSSGGNNINDNMSKTAGSYSARTGIVAGGMGQSLLSKVAPGKTYRVKASARMGNTTDVGTFGIRFYDSAGAIIATASNRVTGSAFLTYSSEIVAPPVFANASAFFWKEAGGTSYFYIDEFAVVEVVPPTFTFTITGPSAGQYLQPSFYTTLSGVVSATTGVVSVIYTVNGEFICEVQTAPHNCSYQTSATAGKYTVVAYVTAANGASMTRSQEFNVTTPLPTFRIDAGASVDRADSLGQIWSADRYFVGGSLARNSVAIANTTEDFLFNTERYGPMTYSIPMPMGTYTVKLYFSESWNLVTNNYRLMDVNIEGTLALNDFDLFAQAGSVMYSAVTRSFTATVVDGFLDIEFIVVPGKANPLINAIEVTPK